MNAKPISEKPKFTWMQTGCVVLFGSVFIAVGVGLLGFGVLFPWLSSQASQGWTEVPCKILSSEVRRHDGDDSVSYSIEIEYQYTLDNQTFRSSQYDFNVANKSRNRCRQIVADLPPGKQTVCFVDPDDPQSAVIDRQFKIGWLFLLIGCVFPAAGVATVMGAFFSGRKKRSSKIVSPTTPHSDGPIRSTIGGNRVDAALHSDDTNDANDAEDAEDEKWDCPQRLKPTTSPLKNFLGLSFIAIFWNGIVSIFLWNLFAGGFDGIFTIFMGLFLTPFILVGAVIIAGTLWAFLSMFSPVVEIATSSGTVSRSGTVDVAWEIKGNPNRIDRLQIAAMGTEQSRYRQGTDTVTDTSHFDQVIVIDTQDTPSIAFGSTSIIIPANTMHTFEDQNNQVTWALHVKATMRRWPDVSQQYLFRVRP